MEGGASTPPVAAAAASSSSAAAEMPAAGVATALSEGVLSVLSPMVAKCDSSIKHTIESQVELSRQIDRAASELQNFLGASNLPSFAPHAERLADIRRRVAAADSTMVQVQARLGRIEDMANRLEQDNGSMGHDTAVGFEHG